MCDKCRVFHYGVDIGCNLWGGGYFRVKHWTYGQGVFEKLELPVSFLYIIKYLKYTQMFLPSAVIVFS